MIRGSLIPIDSDDGKLSPAVLDATIRGRGNVHVAQPATLSFAQAVETGTVYQLDEISALTEVAQKHGLSIHMDGARFANAIAALNCTPAEMTWQSGVDVLSFGGTKNGCLVAEAVVFFKPDCVADFAYYHKRAGQLLSKMRFVSAQLDAYIKNDVWLRNARQANRMARRLCDGLASMAGVELAFPVESNEIFAHLPRAVITRLNNAGFQITEGELDETAPPRFVTAWNTTTEDVDVLLQAVEQAIFAPAD